MKKFSFLIAFIMLMGIMIPPTHAASGICQETEIIHTEFGDFEIESTLVVYDMARSNSKTAHKSHTVKYGGKVIAEVTLSATFGYDGNTAWVISASGSHMTYEGWSYSGEKITESGGTVTLVATLSKLLAGSVPINISMTCSPTGQIS